MLKVKGRKVRHRLLFFTAMATVCVFFAPQSCGNSNTKESVTRITDGQCYIVQQETPIDSIVGAYLCLDKSRYDFGKIRSKRTPKIAIEFEVANLGKAPLVILKADVFCGCMSVDYPKAPIFPQGRAKLTVTIDTKNQIGVFNKPVFIKSTADNDIVTIRILGEIEK
ncbi:MAG: DUF1573 domain-containing protein [Bacteroidales bacterium]|nr:DUF1573 domain-containing protein [Bacteroidales bacterium]